MELSNEMVETIKNAEQLAIASNGEDGINIAPLSSVHTEDGLIMLYDFFMDKTAQNVKQNPEVALAVWIGMAGIQIKGKVSYQTEGDIFTSREAWAKVKFPDRILKGVLVLTPEVVYDLTPSNAGARLA